MFRPALSVFQITVDMTNGMQRLEAFRKGGCPRQLHPLAFDATPPAKALALNPTLHQVVAGTRRHRPSAVDIGLSVTGETFVTPVLVIEGANRKSIEEISTGIASRTPEVRKADAQMLRLLRRWGRLVPLRVHAPRYPADALHEPDFSTQGRRHLPGFRFRSI